MATTSNIKISHNSTLELKQKQEAINVIANSDQATAEKLHKLITSPKAKSLLTDHWFMISMML